MNKIAIMLVLSFSLLFGATSCVVVYKTDNGKHKGWYKNRNNPHHPNSTNPGHTKKEHKEEHKEKHKEHKEDHKEKKGKGKGKK